RKDLADEVRIDLEQITPGNRPPVQAVPCSKVSEHFGLPDPTHGDPLAWCFSTTPFDDRTTPGQEHLCDTAGADCFAPLSNATADDQAATLVLKLDAVEPYGPLHPMPM